jgi:hypothetical protein
MRKNQVAKGTTALGRELPEEQPSANGPPPHQQEEVKMVDLAMSEQRMITIEDGMNNLKEMIQKQAEEIERTSKEHEAWQKQPLEFQTILVNFGVGQQAPQQQENQRDRQDHHAEKQVSMVGP